jgi:hypothetical protein
MVVEKVNKVDCNSLIDTLILKTILKEKEHPNSSVKSLYFLKLLEREIM